jgi:hypothetical protein
MTSRPDYGAGRRPPPPGGGATGSEVQSLHAVVPDATAGAPVEVIYEGGVGCCSESGQQPRPRHLGRLLRSDRPTTARSQL